MTEHPHAWAEATASLSPAADPAGSRLLQPYSPPSRVKLSTLAPAFDPRRQGIGRSRSTNSVRADSIRRSEGLRVVQDTRRYMLAAAAHTQATVQQLLSRLQTYRAFQPFLSAPDSYRDESFAHERDCSIASGLSRGRGSAATVSTNQLWQMIDRFLDTSVAQLLQHNAESHFIVTLESTLGLEVPTSILKSSTVIESRKATTSVSHCVTSESAGAERTPSGSPHLSPPHKLPKAAAMPLATTGALVDRWALDHPYSTAAEVEEQRRSWAVLDQQRQHASLSFYLQAVQEQLETLEAEETRDASKSTHSHRSQGDASRSHHLPLHSSSDSEDQLNAPLRSRGRHGAAGQVHEDDVAAAEAEAEKQRALWQTFCECPLRTAGAPASPPGMAPNAPQIMSAFLDNTDLQEWLYSSWAHRTHRHESAALRIQCAYRMNRARCEVREMRYERRQAFLASLDAEREAKLVWDMALQVQTESTATSCGADSTLWALHFFINKVNAVVAKRRACKKYQQQQADEVRNYAATRIQAVYRGHRSRVFVMELRHPEIVAHREHLRRECSAMRIQSCWRRYTAQRQWWRVRLAASALQNLCRCRAARRMRAERRYERDLSAARELRKVAVRRIEQWYASCRVVRNAIYGSHVAELLTIQRVCRGYQGRRRAQDEMRLSHHRSAVRTIEQHRLRVLCLREAGARRAALSATRAAKRAAAMLDDAAVTIQRAWRRQGRWQHAL
ncbi:hypothetical protein LSCM1_05619 [Leishmania martiniquensis]|uniref:Uncharacterized protein n=1 Tax=Leishmania martiniquensis TaxID=1580590 RepID=A0A836KSX9_9TRYP|nr:hypothetical protein LSCM1_05619 [Leishmania martiniquensis]